MDWLLSRLEILETSLFAGASGAEGSTESGGGGAHGLVRLPVVLGGAKWSIELSQSVGISRRLARQLLVAALRPWLLIQCCPSL